MLNQMIGNMFPILELIWRMNNDTKRSNPNVYDAYTPPGDALARVKAPPGPPRPINTSKWKQQFF